MKPLVHAMTAAKRFGGAFADYLPLHEMMDASKMAVAGNRHRALFHHDLGVGVAVATFGPTIRNADGVEVPTREVAERHCVEDVGFVPTLEAWLGAGVRQAAFLTTRIRRPGLEAIREDPASGLAARYGGEPWEYADLVAHLEVGARRSGSPHGLAAAIGLNSMTCVLAERRFGPALRVGGRKAPIPVREVGEMMALARWGIVPSLHMVVGGIAVAAWMGGACRSACMRGEPCPAERADGG